MSIKELNEKIVELYKEGLEISEIIVKLNTTYKRVVRAINVYEENRKRGE